MTTTPWRDFRADLRRYPRFAWLTEPSVWAVATYRLGRATLGRSGVGRVALLLVYAAIVPLVRIVTKIELPRTASIGPGLRIWHSGPVVVHANATIGRHCSIHGALVLGDDWSSDEAPTVGDNVTFGSNSMALGAVKLGDGARVGAMTLVLQSVPPGATVVGVPGRVLD